MKKDETDTYKKTKEFIFKKNKRTLNLAVGHKKGKFLEEFKHDDQLLISYRVKFI